MSLWIVGRGTTPSSSSTSGSRATRRRCRGSTPDPPASNHLPRTDNASRQPAATHDRSTAKAPANLPLSSQRRRRRRRRDEDEEGEQKSTARSPPPPWRSCPNNLAPRPLDATRRRCRDEDHGELIRGDGAGIEPTPPQKPNKLDYMLAVHRSGR